MALDLVEMSCVRVSHLYVPFREVFGPTPMHLAGSLGVSEQLFGVPVFHAGIDPDAALVDEMVPLDDLRTCAAALCSRCTSWT